MAEYPVPSGARKTGIISLDLQGFTGFVPGGPILLLGSQLPRGNKSALETHIARNFLSKIFELGTDSFSDLRPHVPDPPDVQFSYCAGHVGIELAEMLPPNRLGKDGILTRLRDEILAELKLGSETRDRIFHIFFQDDYAVDFRPGHIGRQLGRAIAGICTSGHGTGSLTVPPSLTKSVLRLSYDKSDLSVDPRIGDRNEPLIIFGAQATLLCPEDDCPKIVSSVLDRKMRHDVSMPTWLLLWSEHHAMAPIHDYLIEAIRSELGRRAHGYERVFYFHIGVPLMVEEFLG